MGPPRAPTLQRESEFNLFIQEIPFCPRGRDSNIKIRDVEPTLSLTGDWSPAILRCRRTNGFAGKYDSAGKPLEFIKVVYFVEGRPDPIIMNVPKLSFSDQKAVGPTTSNAVRKVDCLEPI